MANRRGNSGNSDRHYFGGLQNHCKRVTASMKLKDTCSLEEKLLLDSILKSRDVTLPTKVCLVKVMVFPVVMYGCECRLFNDSHSDQCEMIPHRGFDLHFSKNE